MDQMRELCTDEMVNRFLEELNTMLPSRNYVAASQLGSVLGGTDKIRTDVILDSNKLTFCGAAMLDDSFAEAAPFVARLTVGTLFNGPNSNWPPIAATLEDKSCNAMVTVVPNHRWSERRI